MPQTNLGIGLVGVSLAFGLSVLTGAYALGDVSGGHFNPVVTAGHVVGRRFPARDALGYVIAQLVGAIVAAAVLAVIANGLDGFSLSDSGFAANGFDAGMMVKEYRPDLIILDVMLPDINGKEVCHRVRSDNSLEDVRIICISGMVEDDKIQELKLAGADDFLHKPFDVDLLIERMCQQLEMEPATTA